MISDNTRALLAEVLSKVFTHAELDHLFLKHEIGEYNPGGVISKLRKSQTVLEEIRDSLNYEREASLVASLSEECLQHERFENLDSDLRSSFEQALNSDGWDFINGKLLPSTQDVADIAPQISYLQLELQSRGLHIALSHYDQAVENYKDSNLEASNGQLRSFLENLYIELCDRAVGRRFGNPEAAVQHLQQTDVLDSGEFNLVRGLHEISNQRGAHQGLSEREEALFRLHVSTAVGRYLLTKLESD